MSPRDDTPDSQDQPQVSGAGEAPVNPEAPVQPVAPSDGDAGGGIFSTPELTVNTENAAVEGAELSDENKSRIAAAFQSTDATQKQQEAQAMNAAALAASDIPSTATGDIKLNTEKKKHGKALVLVLVIIGIIVAVVAYFAVSVLRERASVANVRTAYENYGRTLITGDDTLECSPPDNITLLEHLGSSECSITAMEIISDRFLGAFEEFKTLFDASSFSEDDELSLLVAHQGVYTRIIAQYIRQVEQQDKIIQLYNIGQGDLTVEEINNTSIEDVAFDGTLELFAEYLDLRTSIMIKEYQVYNDSNCLLSGLLDYTCVELITTAIDLETDDLGLSLIYEELGAVSDVLEQLFEQVAQHVLVNYYDIKEAINNE